MSGVPTDHSASTPWPHPACLSDDALLAQCGHKTGRSGGPGGQNRNKVETLVELTHLASGIEAHAGERRSQMENRSVALRRLRLALAVGVRVPVPSGSVGSDLWRSRRRAAQRDATAGSPPKSPWTSGGEGMLEINPDHRDYPAMLAEALDVLASAGWDAKTASLRLNISASQLVKLIKEHPPALAMVNREREHLGQHKFK